jgi:hypothetical protein
MQNHRNFVRWQINRQARLKLEQAVEDVFCQVKDINYKGAQVILKAKLPQDTAFRLHLRLSDNCTFDAEVWVAWAKVINGVNHYGLYFSKLRDADKDKIYRFVHAHLPKELVDNWWSEDSKPIKKNEINIKNVDNKIDEVSKNNTEQESGEINDHRIFERFPVNLSARYLNVDTGKEGIANTQDVSAKGLGFATSEELRLHTALEIWLEMKDNRESLYTRGEVVWVKKVDTNNYKFGVELEKADLMGISRVFKS